MVWSLLGIAKYGELSKGAGNAGEYELEQNKILTRDQKWSDCVFYLSFSLFKRCNRTAFYKKRTMIFVVFLILIKTILTYFFN